MLAALIAILASGSFFGASVYISLVQHPAALEAGVGVAEKFFPPMYKRASIMQVSLAIVGFISGLITWYISHNVLWGVGAAFLISVVPITVFLIKPINDVLLALHRTSGSSNTQQLLLKWGAVHWLRTVVSGVAFVIYLLVGLV